MPRSVSSSRGASSPAGALRRAAKRTMAARVTPVRAQRTGAGELCFLVPAAAETARRKGEAVEWVPTLELTLCFDEAKLSLEEAARFLGDTCRNLENFWDLLL